MRFALCACAFGVTSLVLGVGCGSPPADQGDAEAALRAVALAADAIERGDSPTLCRIVTPATRVRWYDRADCSLAVSTSTPVSSLDSDVRAFDESLVRALRSSEVLAVQQGVVELQGHWGDSDSDDELVNFYYYTREPGSGLQLNF